MEFKKYKISDIAEVIGGGTPSTKKTEYYGDDIAWLTPKDLSNFNRRYINKGERSLTTLGLQRSSARLMPANTVLFTSRAPIGYVAISKNNISTNQGFKSLICRQDKILPEYMYYLMKFNTPALENQATGSTFKEVSGTIVKNFEVLIPDINEQKKIIDILGSLDSKIELNLDLISKLEEISKILFKHWFVDFEFPNEEGKPYKSSGGDMIDSELGDIPATWSIIKLSDITKILKKTFNPKKTDVENVIHFSLPAYDKNQLPTLDNVSTIKSNKWLLEDNCVVFSKMNPRTARVWLPNLKNDLLNVASSEFVVLKNNNRESNSFIYNLCKSEAFNEYLIAHATGSTNSRQRVTPAVALDFKMALSHKMMESYGEAVMGMSEAIKSLHEEYAYLQQIRDSLLPKLLSGEIKIPNELEV